MKQMIAGLSEEKLNNLLCHTQSFMNHVHYVQQKFNLLPDNEHFGTFINHVDLKEFRGEFLDELINTICEWVYSQSKARGIVDKLRSEGGRSEQNANSQLRLLALKKFRRTNGNSLVLQGQFGELLLFNFLQHFFKAVPLLRKMPITTSVGHERFGSDAIHYKRDGENNILLLGESKAYTSDYQFSKAFETSLASILNTWQKINDELDLYTYNDFLEDELEQIAIAYKEGRLANVKIHLVCLIAYNETKQFKKLSESQIKTSIIEIITERCKNLDSKIYKCFSGYGPLFNRITYIVFPFWEFEDLVREFQREIGN